MSNIILGGGPSGGGSVTLQAPNTNSNQTVNIPDRTGNLMMDGPAFSAYAGANQNISGSTWTKLNINTEEFDTANCFDTSTYRFTPNVAGYYQVNGQVFYGFGTVSRMIVAINKNGGTFKLGNDVNAAGFRMVVSALIYMNGTTDYLELYTYYAGSGSGTGGNGSADTYFQAYLVRAA